MNAAGTSSSFPVHGRSNGWLITAVRYQLRPPRKPLAVNDSTRWSACSSVHPWRRLVDRRERVEQRAPLAEHEVVRVAVVAAEGAVEREQPAPRIGVELLGGGVALEPALVVVGPDGEVEGGEDVDRPRRQERHAHPHDAPHQVGTEQRRVPHDGRAPVVADDHRLRCAQSADERDDVAHQWSIE